MKKKTFQMWREQLFDQVAYNIVPCGFDYLLKDNFLKS